MRIGGLAGSGQRDACWELGGGPLPSLLLSQRHKLREFQEAGKGKGKHVSVARNTEKGLWNRDRNWEERWKMVNMFGLPRWLKLQRICLQSRRCRFHPWVGKIPCRKKWLPTPVFLPGESHGQRSPAGYRPWGHKESDMTEQLSTHKHDVWRIFLCDVTV